MTEDTKCKILDILSEKWKKILQERYKNSQYHDVLVDLGVDNLKDITNRFYELNLNDSNFDKEILNKEQYHQRLSEIIVSDRLLRDGFELSSKDYGPDFKATKNGKTVWFEVITPDPKSNVEMKKMLEQSVEERLRPNPEDIHRKNSLALFKMTSAIQEKSEKIKRYIRNKIIPDNEPVIIIVNDSLFFQLDVFMVGLTVEIFKGVSGKPLSIEALLGLDSPVYISNNPYLTWRTRNEAVKDNGSSVKTNGFFSGTYNHISGVFVMTAREDYGISLAIYNDIKNKGLLVKNLNSNNILPDGLLNTKIFDSNVLNEILNDTSQTGFCTKTLQGENWDMIKYIDLLIKKSIVKPVDKLPTQKL